MSWSLSRRNVSLRVTRFAPESHDVKQEARAVESGRPVSLERGVGAVDPNGSGDTPGTITIAPRIWPATARAPFRVVRVR